MNATVMETLAATLNRFVDKSKEFLPNLMAGLLITLFGLIIAFAVKLAVRWTLKAARFDDFCAQTGAVGILTKADISEKPSVIAGRVVFWIIFLLFLMTGVSALGSEVWSNMVAEFFLYVPKIVSAFVILFVGYVIGNFLARATLLAAVNAGFPSPGMVSHGAKALTAILAFSMALEQLGIAKSIVISAFSITFGAIMLALAISFGLGGRKAARKFIEKTFSSDGKEEKDPFSHV